MLTLNDGRAELWQWDTGRTLAVDADCSQVHFSNKLFGRSIDVDVVDGVAIIPDILLQTDKDLNVWAFVGTAENGYTKISKTFKVNRRNKPADYVFTPVDQTTIEEIAAIAQSVRDDADAGLFDGKDGNDGYTPQKGVDYFDGAPGADGHTPEYGVDYGTPEQITEIAQSAAEILQPEINQIKKDLSAEQTAREQADTSLQQELSGKLPKSPANWEQWTAEEQAAARERMGIPGDYEEICDIVLTEDSIIDIDLNGNFIRLCIIAHVPATSTVSGNMTISTSNEKAIFIPSNALFVAGVEKYGIIFADKVSHYWSFVVNCGSNLYACNNTFSRGVYNRSKDSYMDLVGNKILSAGTEIIVLGVRA